MSPDVKQGALWLSLAVLGLIGLIVAWKLAKSLLSLLFWLTVVIGLAMAAGWWLDHGGRQALEGLHIH